MECVTGSEYAHGGRGALSGGNPLGEVDPLSASMTQTTPFDHLIQLLGERARTDAALRAALHEALRAVKWIVDSEPAGELISSHMASGDGRGPFSTTHGDGAADPTEIEVCVAEEPRLADTPPIPALSDEAIRRLQKWADREVEPESDAVAVRTGPPTDEVLRPLARRLHAKAQMAQWRAEGSSTDALGDVKSRVGGVEGLDRWILDESAPSGDADSWGLLSAAYHAAAESADALAAFAEAREPLVDGSPFAALVVAAAEAQSAVRTAYYGLRGIDAGAVAPCRDREESDQLALFEWIREATAVGRVYVSRHLRADDPADPRGAGDVEGRIRALVTEAGLGTSADVDRALSAVAYHAKRLRGALPDEVAYQTSRLLAKLEAAISTGVRPTDRRLLYTLAPVEAVLLASGEEMSAGAARAVAALKASEPYDNEWAAAPTAHGPDVQRAAALLRGKRVAVFGGVPKPERARALEEAFGLASLEWVESRAHQSTAPFEAVVARCDVAILLIRWCSHSFEALKGYCEAHETAYVRLPGGYSPDMVAHHVLRQVSGEMSAAT